jgi:hypothetical protein
MMASGAIIAIAVGLVVGVFIVALIVLTIRKTNEKTLIPSGEQKPEWVRSMPPAETLAATHEENKNFQIFDHDTGEKLASPFAEQIEDILTDMLKKDPAFKSYKIDLGTAPNGALEIWVNEKKYDSVEALPDPRLKEFFRAAVERWNKS